MTSDDILKQAQSISNNGQALSNYLSSNRAKAGKEMDKDDDYLELTMAQFIAVSAIDEHGFLTVKELAKILGISSPSTTSLVDTLVNKGIFTREHSKKDRRKVIVRISPEVAEAVEKSKRIYLQSIIDLIHKVGPETTQKWCEVYNELKRAIEE